MDKFIVVAGNIGAGKSTLVQLLSERLGFHPFFEPVNDNPYLEDFYSDMRSWAFHSQLYFLTRRLRIHKQLLEAEGSVVQDRSVYEDAEIFARNLYLQNLSVRGIMASTRIYTKSSSLCCRRPTWWFTLGHRWTLCFRVLPHVDAALKPASLANIS